MPWTNWPVRNWRVDGEDARAGRVDAAALAAPDGVLDDEEERAAPGHEVVAGVELVAAEAVHAMAGEHGGGGLDGPGEDVDLAGPMAPEALHGCHDRLVRSSDLFLVEGPQEVPRDGAEMVVGEMA